MDLMSAVEVIRAPLSETQARLSAVFAEAIPHRALAQLAANCPFAPFKTYGESPGAPGSSVKIADLAAIRPLVPARGTWQGRATVAGVEVPVLAVAIADLGDAHGGVLTALLGVLRDRSLRDEDARAAPWISPSPRWSSCVHGPNWTT